MKTQKKVINYQKIVIPKELCRNVKLSEEDQKAIYYAYHAEGNSIISLAKKYNVKSTTIGGVVNPDKCKTMLVRNSYYPDKRKQSGKEYQERSRERTRYKKELLMKGLVTIENSN